MSVIGFFDSGFGGLSVVRKSAGSFRTSPSSTSAITLEARMAGFPATPFHRYTLEGVLELFHRGATLVVLACNTSSSVALRRIQQEYLPLHFPQRNVLGIVIPTAEEVSRLSVTKVIGVLATEVTVNSQAYPQEICKIDPLVQVRQQACPLLVPLIESENCKRRQKRHSVRRSAAGTGQEYRYDSAGMHALRVDRRRDSQYRSGENSNGFSGTIVAGKLRTI
jgi:glutamate racemase